MKKEEFGCTKHRMRYHLNFFFFFDILKKFSHLGKGQKNNVISQNILFSFFSLLVQQQSDGLVRVLVSGQFMPICYEGTEWAVAQSVCHSLAMEAANSYTFTTLQSGQYLHYEKTKDGSFLQKLVIK